MKNVILLHGKNTGPEDKWYPWFAREMSRLDIKCEIPALPNADEPVMAEWLAVIDNLKPDEDTIFVGHSRGGVAILRWLENQPADYTCRGCILLATNSGRNEHRTIEGETNYGFYTDQGYDFDAIRTHTDRFFVLHSKDDQWVPYVQGVENSQGLHGELITFKGLNHFGVGVHRIDDLVGIVKAV